MFRTILSCALLLSINASGGTHGGGVVLTSLSSSPSFQPSEIEVFNCRINETQDSSDDFQLALERGKKAQIIFVGNSNEKIDFLLQPYGDEIYRSDNMYWHDIGFSYEIYIVRKRSNMENSEWIKGQSILAYLTVYSDSAEPSGAPYWCVHR